MLCKKYRIKFIHVDIVCTLCAFSTLLLNPLKNEYIYMKVYEMHNTTKTALATCNNTNMTAQDHLVAKEASSWILRFDLTMFVPASLAGMILTSWGDKVGRKVAIAIPAFGMMVSNAYLAASIYLGWHLKSLYIYNLVAGSCGYYMTLLMQGYAYISDITQPERRGIRMVILDTALGFGGGIAGFVSGYWIQGQGYFIPVLSSVAIVAFSIMTLPLLPNPKAVRKWQSESLKNENNGNVKQKADENKSKNSTYGSDSINSHKNGQIEKPKAANYKFIDLFTSVWKIYTSDYSVCEICSATVDDKNADLCKLPSGLCPHGGGRRPGRVWRMWFYLISYCLLMFVVVGTMGFQAIFFLSQPLCFTPVLVGVQSGLRFCSMILTPLVVKLQQHVFKFSNNSTIILSLLGWLIYLTLMGFATETYIVFIATSICFIANPAKPLIQAQMSNLVSESEHGAAFAMLSSFEIFTFMIATVSFLTLYPATLSLYHGFAWLFAAFVTLIPLALMTIVWARDRTKISAPKNEKQPLIS